MGVESCLRALQEEKEAKRRGPIADWQRKSAQFCEDSDQQAYVEVLGTKGLEVYDRLQQSGAFDLMREAGEIIECLSGQRPVFTTITAGRP